MPQAVEFSNLMINGASACAAPSMKLMLFEHFCQLTDLSKKLCRTSSWDICRLQLA
jgi:hypothetical protein